jgi:hypothetical protein
VSAWTYHNGLKYRDSREREDEQHQAAGAEQDTDPVKLTVVLYQILGDGHGGHEDEDHPECGLEDEDVPPTMLERTEEARGEEAEDKPDRLAGREHRHRAVLERAAEVAP